MVTDSACSLPPAVVAALGIVVVPLWVTFGGRQYRDDEVAIEDVLAAPAGGTTTSGPSPGEVAEAVARAERGDGVLILTVSRRMSGTYESARVAAVTVAGPGGSGLGGTEPRAAPRVAVLDTGTAAGAQGLVVLAAADAARAGAPLDSVRSAAAAAARQARLVATVPSLEHLARSGRVPGAAALGSRWLGVNPLFEFHDGSVRPLRPALGRRSALQRVVATWAGDAAPHLRRGDFLHVSALHAADPAVAAALLAQVEGRSRPASAMVGSFSPVMVAHTGPGLAGLAWWWEAPAPAATPPLPG